MRVLSLDTTTRAGSVALIEQDRIVGERSGDAARTHAERLPGEMLDLLADHGWTLRDVDLFAVSAGPGSFTGLRVGIAAIQGAAFALRRRVAAVSSLSALGHIAAGAAEPGTFVGAWMDAHRRDVFSALFRVGGGTPFDLDRLHEVEPAMVGTPAASLDRWRPLLGGSMVTMAGDGAVLYADTIEQGLASPRRIVQPTPLLAGAIGRIAVGLARAGTTAPPGGVQPLYVRRPDAEVARDARTRTGS
jgi:tRNA threonylcarbamoyladenosine biosynthesis protein TsaB